MPSLDVAESALKPGCDDWECGSNSPVIDLAKFYKLWENGKPNPEGFKITGVSYAGSNTAYSIDVVDAELLIRYKRTGAILARGYNVAGAVIHIQGPDLTHYALRVLSVGKHEFSARPYTYFGSPPMTWTYDLRWFFPDIEPEYPTGGQPMYPVCGENVEQDGMTDFSAVLVDDENISREKLRVYPVDTNDPAQVGSFLIGCAGHAIAKQHLTGHTKAASHYLLWTTTINQRTANLKMLTGDYCGNGNPFTVAGEKIKWQDEWGYYNTVNDSSVIPMQRVLEARWDENGATCLNTPRVNYKQNPTAAALYPLPTGVTADMAAYCTGNFPVPPPCSGTYNDMQGAHVISVNWKYMIIPL
jgi:hypothetical protein